MLSRIYDFYLVTTSYWPYGLPYNCSGKCLEKLLSLKIGIFVLAMKPNWLTVPRTLKCHLK